MRKGDEEQVIGNLAAGSKPVRFRTDDGLVGWGSKGVLHVVRDPVDMQ